MAGSKLYQQKRLGKDGSVRCTSLIRRDPTYNEVRQLFDYDPDTGILIHKTSRGKATAGQPAGGLDAHGYISLRIFNRLHKAHRIAWLHHYGELPPDGMTVDHINGVRNDNRIVNLQIVTQQMQMWNIAAARDNQSGLIGAWPCKTTGRWQSMIGTNGVRKFLGRFDTPEEAHEAWKSAAAKDRAIPSRYTIEG